MLGTGANWGRGPEVTSWGPSASADCGCCTEVTSLGLRAGVNWGFRTELSLLEQGTAVDAGCMTEVGWY